jgi:hypothetical protein
MIVVSVSHEVYPHSSEDLVPSGLLKEYRDARMN